GCMKKVSWLQVVATILFISSLAGIHMYMEKQSWLDNQVSMLFIVSGSMIVTITYGYVMLALLFMKNKKLVYHAWWRKLPALSLGVGIISFTGFIFLFNMFLSEGNITNLLPLAIIAYF